MGKLHFLLSAPLISERISFELFQFAVFAPEEGRSYIVSVTNTRIVSNRGEIFELRTSLFYFTFQYDTDTRTYFKTLLYVTGTLGWLLGGHVFVCNKIGDETLAMRSIVLSFMT